MDDDIVDKLRWRIRCRVVDGRTWEEANDDCRAADEIERLRAEVNSMASAQAGWGRVARLNDEVERLRAAGDALHAWITVNATVIQQERKSHDEVLDGWEEARRG